ncbi:MAG: hypothetical protein Q9191_007635 [Dirinaria sp. TL-2023a]
MKQAAVSRKVLRRFYEPLLLLNALGQIRGERIKPESDTNSISPSIHKLRRSFVDGIAYICAYEKGPRRVTAAALEQTPEGILVWLAANENIGVEVTRFLGMILSDVQHIAELDDREDRQLEGEKMLEDLTSRIVAFNAPRIQTYYEQVARKYAPACLDTISSGPMRTDHAAREGQSHLDDLVGWLRETFIDDSSTAPDVSQHQMIVRSCYEKRRSPSFDILKRFAGLGESRRSEFEQLFKLLCKLGKHVHIAKKLVEAAVSLAQDFAGGFRIERLPSAKEQKLPLTSKEATIESTIHRMYSTVEEQTRFMARLGSIWDPCELSELLHSQHNTKTRVHAELLLIDHFDRHGCHFLDGNDKYIGCSKPACYLCYAYINCHPGRYAAPPSHQKLYVGWRPPDINQSDQSIEGRQTFQKRIMLKLIEWIRRDLATDIENRTSRFPYHADSTAGMTSASKTAASQASPSLSALSVDGPNLDG